MKFNRILFPVDLSENSEKMAPFASMAADKFNAAIHILFVVREVEYYSDMCVSTTTIENFRHQVIRGSDISLNKFREKHFKSQDDVTCSVVSGDIADEILAAIKTDKTDLLLLGTHGRKGLEKIVFGSIADRLMKISPVPVLLVNPYKAVSFFPDTRKKRKILFPVDLSEISPKLVPYVELLAGVYNADIQLLSVVRPSGYFAALYQPDHSLEEFTKTVLSETETSLADFKEKHFIKYPETKTAASYGLIPEEILKRIDTDKIDLLVMGTHGRRGLDKILFGSVAEKVAKLSPVPLLLINPYRNKL